MHKMENVKEKEEKKIASPCHYSTMTNKLTISRKSFLKNDKEENFSIKHNDRNEKNMIFTSSKY